MRTFLKWCKANQALMCLTIGVPLYITGYPFIAAGNLGVVLVLAIIYKV